MTLKDHCLKWREDGNKSLPDYAAYLGQKNNTIRKIFYGQRKPSAALALKIEAATAGEVSFRELMAPGI